MTKVGNICDECLLLEKGRLVHMGKPLDVIAAYWEKLWGKEVKTIAGGNEGNGLQGWVKGARRWGSGEIRITGFSLFDIRGKRTQAIEQGSPFTMEIRFQSEIDCDDYLVQVSLFQGKTTVAIMKSDPAACPRIDHQREGKVVLKIDSRPLAKGEYFIDVEIRNEAFTRMYDHLDKFAILRIVQGERRDPGSEWMELPCQWTFSAGEPLV
jgi:hypothetical protein